MRRIRRAEQRRGLARTVPVAGALSVLLIALAAQGAAASGPAGSSGSSGSTAGRAVRVSTGAACRNSNAEVETAADPASGALYEEWIGCGGIGFARSTDGGKTFGRAFELPGSAFGWDPAVVVGPAGKVYAAFMVSLKNRSYPVVDISSNGGKTFPVVRSLIPPGTNNWGDRDFIAVGRHGTIYVTWDYGPKALTPSDFICSPTGSCSFGAGDVNVVLQKSTDGGKTWSKIMPISPGFPGSGADSAPILVEPDGRVDVLYQDYQVLNRKTLKLGVAYNYFTILTDHGRKWTRRVRVGPVGLTMNNSEWWIDGSVGVDGGGNLYATWDTQSGGRDVGWLEYSRNHGRTWSALIRVTPDNNRAAHIVQVTGGTAGISYVGWLTDGPRQGYAAYLRTFSIRRGWLGPAIRVSPKYGNRFVWPGDTIGLSVLPGGAFGSRRVAVSFGSAYGGRTANSEIWATVVSHLP